jgi:hypothetical protein
MPSLQKLHYGVIIETPRSSDAYAGQAAAHHQIIKRALADLQTELQLLAGQQLLGGGFRIGRGMPRDGLLSKKDETIYLKKNDSDCWRSQYEIGFKSLKKSSRSYRPETIQNHEWNIKGTA